jgi:hypothetical protein
MPKTIFPIIIAILMIFTGKFTTAQTPSWVNEAGRKVQYNERDYLVGFASEVNTNRENPSDVEKRVVNYAKAQLIEYIQVTVRSEMEHQTTESGRNFTDIFRSTVSSEASLELVGLKTETSYDNRSRTAYALAYAKKSDLEAYYRNLLNTQVAETENQVQRARQSIQGNDVKTALALISQASSGMNAIRQSQEILMALQPRTISLDGLLYNRVMEIRNQSGELLRLAQRSEQNTLQDACLFLARGLTEQAGSIGQPILLTSFTYQDSRMASNLSRWLNPALSSQMVREGRYNITDQRNDAEKPYIVTGSFWEESNDLKIIAVLKDQSGKVIATSEAYLPKKWLRENNIGFLPENFEDTYTRLKAFEHSEIIGGNLHLDTWTNKGDENLLYLKDERMKIYVRTNKEAYLRVTYHLADGQMVLLLDNYYIPVHMANKVIELPYEFQCSEPFGVETLQVNAQSEKFSPLRTTQYGGYTFISENKEQAILNSRGMIQVAPASQLQKTEKRIVITTMNK